MVHAVRSSEMRILKYTKATDVGEFVVINFSKVGYQVNKAMNAVSDQTVAEKIVQTVK